MTNAPNRSAMVGARLTLLAFFALSLTGCVKNAATGHSQLNLMSRDTEIQAGTEAMAQMVPEYGGEAPDPALQAYVTKIGKELSTHVEGDYKTLPWEFTLLNSDVVNAFALPGGKVFITRALAEKMTNEAQMAGVLGHEIGHVTAEHADKRLQEQYGFALGGAAASVAIGVLAGEKYAAAGEAGSQAVGAGLQIWSLSFSRSEESEADKLGMRYMTRAGYDPMGQLQVMQILKSVEGAGGSPEFLSTHPAPQTRIDAIKKSLSKEYASTQGNPQYQLYPDRFQSEFLSRLNALPPIPKTKPEAPAAKQQGSGDSQQLRKSKSGH